MAKLRHPARRKAFAIGVLRVSVSALTGQRPMRASVAVPRASSAST
jgi:hypothetical protein